jgi:spore maturation protein CgeB
MKILILCSSLDISKPYSATPALWQLFKGFYEENHEILIMPYQGYSIDSLWWKSVENPNFFKSVMVDRIFKLFKNNNTVRNNPIIPVLAQNFTKPQIFKSIKKVLTKEKDIEAILIIALPLNQINGLSSQIKKEYNIPVIYYDLDIPTSLPQHGGFTFNYYDNAEVDTYDSFIITSEGSVNDLKELGVNNIYVVHFGVDPDIYTPIPMEKDIDLFFFGNGGKSRINNIEMMITQPSKKLSNKFYVSGRDLNVDLGNAIKIPPLSFHKWHIQCCRSKINLNVVRELHAKVFATSTSRPFELAAMKSCIVSSPYQGLEKWFTIGKEIFMAYNVEEFIELYKWLLSNEEIRIKAGEAAFARVMNEHTSRHRVKEIVNILRSSNCS